MSSNPDEKHRPHKPHSHRKRRATESNASEETGGRRRRSESKRRSSGSITFRKEKTLPSGRKVCGELDVDVRGVLDSGNIEDASFTLGIGMSGKKGKGKKRILDERPAESPVSSVGTYDTRSVSETAYPVPRDESPFWTAGVVGASPTDLPGAASPRHTRNTGKEPSGTAKRALPPQDKDSRPTLSGAGRALPIIGDRRSESPHRSQDGGHRSPDSSVVGEDRNGEKKHKRRRRRSRLIISDNTMERYTETVTVGIDPHTRRIKTSTEEQTESYRDKELEERGNKKDKGPGHGHRTEKVTTTTEETSWKIDRNTRSIKRTSSSTTTTETRRSRPGDDGTNASG